MNQLKPRHQQHSTVSINFMIRLSILIILFISSFSSPGQVGTHDLINPKTMQWLHFSSSSSSGYNYYEIINKKNNCERKTIEIKRDRTEQFLDSLKKNGWTKKIKYKSGKNKYKATIELKDIVFLGLT